MLAHLKKKSKSFLVTSFAAFLPALPSLLLARTCQSWTAKGKFTALLLEMAQRCSDIPTYPETPGPDLASKSLHSTPLHISSLKVDSQQMFVRQNYLLSKYTHRHTLSSSSFPFQEHMPLKCKRPVQCIIIAGFPLGNFQLLEWLRGYLPVDCPPPTHTHTHNSLLLYFGFVVVIICLFVYCHYYNTNHNL